MVDLRARPAGLAWGQLVVGGLFALVSPGEGVALWWRTRGLEAVTLLAPPPIWFDGPVFALGVALALTSVVVLLRGRALHPAPRLLAMLAVLVVFAKLLFVPDPHLPYGAPAADAYARQATERLATGLQAALAAEPHELPLEAEGYAGSLEALGGMPVIFRGVPVGGFRADVRQGCEGPQAPAEEAAPGTIVLCLGADRRSGWLSVQGLDERAGRPAALRDEGGSLWSVALRGGGPARKG